MKKLLTATLFLILLPPTLAAEPDPRVLQAKHALLRAEYELARQTLVYFHFDLEGRRVLFKSRGLPLTELPMVEVRRWGPRSAVQVRTLVARTSGGEPERPRVRAPAVGEAEKPRTLEIQALELQDMPTAFTAVLDDGTRLHLRPAAQSWIDLLPAALDGATWYLSRPLISVWNFLRRKPYTEVRIVLQPRDVQRLYWSFVEEGRCLVGP